MNETITLKSGAELSMTVAPFADGMKLFKTIARELKQVDIELGDLDVSKLAGKDINSIKNVVFQLLGSDAVEACVFDCLKRCTLNGVRITKETFEDENARPDFLPAAWEVIKLNLRPFVSGLNLSFSASAKPQQDGRK